MDNAICWIALATHGYVAHQVLLAPGQLGLQCIDNGADVVYLRQRSYPRIHLDFPHHETKVLVDALEQSLLLLQGSRSKDGFQVNPTENICRIERKN